MRNKFIGRLLIITGLAFIIGMILFEIFPFNQFQDNPVMLLVFLTLGGIIMISTGISTLYFNHDLAKRKRVVAILSISCGLLFLFALLSKFLHAPGASIEMVVAIIFFSLSATPLIIKNRYEKRKTVLSQKLLVISILDLFSVVFILVGLLAKFLHWPGGLFMITAGILGILFSFYNWNRSFRKEVALRYEAENKLKEAFAELEEKHLVIEEKNKEIYDSIHYAQRIQRALLASDSLLKNNLDDFFVLFNPKDIVSGDFYWATNVTGSEQKTNNKKQEAGNNDLFYFIIADSTGHGVPGAFMSLLNISFLNEAINEKNIRKPNEVLDHVRGRLITSLAIEGTTEGGNDGMDCSLMVFDKKNMKLEVCCANNPVLMIRDNELIEIAADKIPVGKSVKNDQSFTLQTIPLKTNDIIYAFTDGFADQFGGPKGKKLKYKQLCGNLLAIHQLPLNQQKDKLNTLFKEWKGSLEQVDDVLIAGIRV